MRLTSLGGLAIVAGSPLVAALGQTIANPAVQEKYASGEVMEAMMAAKFVSMHRFRNQVIYADSNQGFMGCPKGCRRLGLDQLHFLRQRRTSRTLCGRFG